MFSFVSRFVSRMFSFVSELFQNYLLPSNEPEPEAQNTIKDPGELMNSIKISLVKLTGIVVINTNIQSTTLQWFSKLAPNARYVELKGEPIQRPKGYACECTIFANSGPPPNTLGELMDIYLDIDSQHIFSCVDGSQHWRQWPNTMTFHPNPVLPQFRLIALHGSGIRWGTRNSFYIDKSRNPGVLTMEDCINLTMASHPELALNRLDYGALLVQLKLKRAKDSKNNRGDEMVSTDKDKMGKRDAEYKN